MRLFTWDKDGKRIALDTTFEPYIFLETNNHSDATSIFNTKLKRKKFDYTKIRIYKLFKR